MAQNLTTFRDTIRRITPRWLQGRLGERLLYTVAVHLDLLGDAVVEAIWRRFPGYLADGPDGDPVRYDSLPITGRERRIRRGPGETDAGYALRLRRWLDDHPRRGGPIAMLEQTGAYWASTPTPFRIDLVYRTGRTFTRDPDSGVITRTHTNWTPGGDPAQIAHWWLFYYWPTTISSDGIWSDPGTWGDGGVWDSSLTVEEATEIRLVPTEWNSARCRGTVILLSPGIELWDFPAGVWSDPGVWGSDLDQGVQLQVDW